MIRVTLRGKSLQHRFDNLPLDQRVDVRRYERTRGERSHPPGIRPRVAIKRPFVVLCRGESEGLPTVANGEERYLGTDQALLDDDAPTG